MPAHLRVLQRCSTCGKPATCELRNTRNATLGYYCSRHGTEALHAHREKCE